MNNDTCRVEFSQIQWTSPAAGVRVKIHRHNGRQLRLVEFAKGFVELDWCLRGHIGFVLEGSMELTFPDATVSLQKGDGIFIPAGDGHKHKGRVLTDVFVAVLVEDVQ